MCELLTVSSLQSGINSTFYSFLHSLSAKLPAIGTGQIYLRKIILLNVQQSEPFSIECSLVEKTTINPAGTFGVFYGPKTSDKPHHICIVNQNALPMSMVSTAQELDTVTISVSAIKERLVCEGIIVEFRLEYEWL